MNKFFLWVKERVRHYQASAPERRQRRLERLEHEALVSEQKAKIARNLAKIRKADMSNKPKEKDLSDLWR